MIQVDPGSCEEITLDSNEGAFDVGTLNIGFGKDTRIWDMTTNKEWGRYLHCVLESSLSRTRSNLHY